MSCSTRPCHPRPRCWDSSPTGTRAGPIRRWVGGGSLSIWTSCRSRIVGGADRADARKRNRASGKTHARRMLNEYEEPKLDEGVKEVLLAYIARRERENPTR
ncbi:trimethylamine methyltransferase family protein [Roseovarius sp. B08]|uniref:trimethylamine methyltransferase family protein n=1 Tax=Roseovarius sp. B08 TaxID=3449223 RepID=UPI003EDC8412